MAPYQEYFRGKRITLIGLGLLGRGVGDIRFLALQGADLIVTDLKDEKELKESLDSLKGFTNIQYRLGGHNIQDFKDRDLIINGPSVPLDSIYLQEAKKNKIPVSMSTALFARFAKDSHCTLIGITGTRGKSTTTQLIYQILIASGRDTLLGGNIKGVSTLSLLPEIKEKTTVVLELDSWQLQGFREELLSPDIAVFTTFFPDHLNYYRNSMDMYLEDKAEIFLHQKPGDVIIFGEQAASVVKNRFKDKILSNIKIAYSSDVPRDWRLKIPGEHNRSNISCAILVAREMGVSDLIIKKTCEEFSGVEGRLQYLRDINGVQIYNDTTATTPEATQAAITALVTHDNKNIILVLGGADKNLDMSDLIIDIHKYCKKLVFLAGTGTDRIRRFFPEAHIHLSLEEATKEALQMSTKGDILLFSPAFASFGMFKNEYDRGEQFTHMISKL